MVTELRTHAPLTQEPESLRTNAARGTGELPPRKRGPGRRRPAKREAPSTKRGETGRGGRLSPNTNRNQHATPGKEGRGNGGEVQPPQNRADEQANPLQAVPIRTNPRQARHRHRPTQTQTANRSSSAKGPRTSRLFGFSFQTQLNKSKVRTPSERMEKEPEGRTVISKRWQAFLLRGKCTSTQFDLSCVAAHGQTTGHASADSLFMAVARKARKNKKPCELD